MTGSTQKWLIGLPMRISITCNVAKLIYHIGWHLWSHGVDDGSDWLTCVITSVDMCDHIGWPHAQPRSPPVFFWKTCIEHSNSIGKLDLVHPIMSYVQKDKWQLSAGKWLISHKLVIFSVYSVTFYFEILGWLSFWSANLNHFPFALL